LDGTWTGEEEEGTLKPGSVILNKQPKPRKRRKRKRRRKQKFRRLPLLLYITNPSTALLWPWVV
jgi:hypothetical protein